MASLLRRPITAAIVNRYVNISTTAVRNVEDVNELVKKKEAPQIRKDIALLKPEELAEKRKHEQYITVEKNPNISSISGIPSEQILTRRVRIFRPAKNAMQSGTDNLHQWQIDFDTKERWENPLMGWSSTGDPLSNMSNNFSSKDDAIDYCERNGWFWYLQEENPKKEMKPKSYGVNFAWNKRTRVSTK